MNDKEFLEKITNTRKEVNHLIDDLVKEAIEAFPTYEEAVSAIKQGKFLSCGNTGQLIIDETVKKIQNIALKKATNDSDSIW